MDPESGAMRAKIAGTDMRLMTSLTALIGSALAATSVSAQTALEDLEIVGAPIPNGVGFQPAATELARDVQWLDNFLLIIITVISLFVTGLLAYVILRYNSKTNPTPSTFTHNSPLEVAWTVVPIVILVVIGAWSLPILFKQQEIPEADLTIKVTGYQWYWGYEYVDDGVAFESYMIGYGEGNMNPDIKSQLEEAGYSENEFRLATDTAVVVPINTTVVMQVTGADVIHSWTIPAFGVKQDAVPGRLAELWFSAEREGIYFGQCSELCGKDHAYMPITVKVVSQEVYDAWLEGAKVEYGV
ncbi:cytochrome c oxidase, subunit II [Thalassobium sp. R2A62]|jgi:cytochrome c oxidase subunit 2|nr:cytochrome c oxidase, subunit II [Thalassobium sp. R2A62]